jgi:hypothetical protein
MSQAPGIEIRHFALAGEGIARVVVDVTHNAASRANPALVAAALRTKLDNSMEAVAGSFQSLDKGMFVERLTGIVGAVRQIISADASSMKGFSAFASNMFMDDEKNMWQMHKTAAGQILVKSTGIDDDMTLASMLESCSSSTAAANSGEYQMMVAQASSVASSVEAGDYVDFVNMDNQIAQAFVVASVTGTDKLIVLSAGAEEPEQISKVAVTTIHDTAAFPDVEDTKEQQVETVVAAARNGIDLEFLLSYYKRVYARSPAFFAQFASRLKSHAFC